MNYTIRNWKRFQHYKDRCPPWIKLHWEVLSSRDWVMLADDSRVLMVACMLIASRNEGIVPGDPEYIKRVAYLNKKPNFEPLIKAGFLEPQADASGCLQKIADDTTETETETETENNPPNPPRGKGKPKQISFKNWSDDDFRKSISESNFDNLLTESQCHEFFNYWTEPNPSGRPKYQLQKTWETRLRMQNARRIIYDHAAPRGFTPGQIHQEDTKCPID